MSVSRFRSASVLLVCIHLGGCTTWQPVQISPREFIETESPYQIRFRDAAGEWIPVTYPRVVRDTISGTTRRWIPSEGRRGDLRIRMAVDDVPTIEAKLINRPQTVLASVTVAVALVGTVLCITEVVCKKAQAVPR
jgi:hypothetical protein